MARVIDMPKLSDTMEEGGIAKWLKKEGDTVKEGEALVEIETDKATQEYESPAEGVVLKLLVQPGKSVALRTPIAVIGEKGEQFDIASIAPKGAGAKVVDMPTAPKPQAAAPTLAAARPADATPVAPAAGSTAANPAGDGGRVRSSPLARKVAADKGIDIGSVQGSGPGGRIVLKDLDGAPAGGAAPATAAPQTISGADRSIPVSMMRKTIAKRLLAAKNDAPHFYLKVSADIGRLDDWRGRLNEDLKSDPTLPKVSVNDLVILAVSRALRRHPMVNASWQGETILQWGSVHVAVAVALPEGLVTPVIRNTDHLGVRDIARQSRELSNKAKEGKLSNNDYAGGTFTISNLGMFGIESFTAIINPPQAAILAVGAAVQTPAVDAKGQLVVQNRMNMTMSCDHRVVDGALGAQFLKTLVGYLEDPLQMMA